MNKSKELLDEGLQAEICRLAGSLSAEAENLIKSQKGSNTSQQQYQVTVEFSEATLPIISSYDLHLIGILSYDGAAADDAQLQQNADSKKINLNVIYEKLRADNCQIKVYHARVVMDIEKQLDDVTKLKDKHAQAELNLKKQLDEVTNLKDKHAQAELNLKKQLYD